MKNYLIYKYTSPSGKSYIGQTCSLNKRKTSHKIGKNGCIAFNDAIKKYEYDNFIFEILEKNLTLEEANIFEALYITEYNTLSPNGYNLRTGGLNYTISEETRIKQSISQLGNTNAKGNKGKIISEETRIKTRNTMKGMNSGENNPHYGKICSKETITKRTEKTRKLYIITFPDGSEIFIKGLVEFCKENNLDNGTMCKVAKGKLNHHKGFKCRYATTEEIALHSSEYQL